VPDALRLDNFILNKTSAIDAFEFDLKFLTYCNSASSVIMLWVWLIE